MSARYAFAFSVIALLLLLTAGNFVSKPAGADSREMVFLGGLNLSSIRTASSVSFSAYTGLSAGLGIDFFMKEQFHIEVDLTYVGRRYSYIYSLPALELPLLIKYENRFVMAGAGLYTALGIGAPLADTGVAAQSYSDLGLSTFDLGWLLSAGLKLPLTQTVSGFAEGRLSRALTNSYSNGDTFYWSQAQAYLGLRISMSPTQRFKEPAGQP